MCRMMNAMAGEGNMYDFIVPSSHHRKGYRPERCAAGVSGHGGWRTYQCSRKRGHGPEQAYCKQHDPVARKEKQDARWTEYKARMDAQQAERNAKNAHRRLGVAAIAALKLIADGHNDPRALAQSVLDGDQ